MSTFNRCIQIILGWEGHSLVSTDANDPGGTTKFGISQKAFPSTDIPGLSLQGALALYHEHYWIKSHAGEFPPWLALVVLDCAVNQGVRTSTLLLQRALGVKEDGWYGPVTRAAVSQAYPENLLITFQQTRSRAYLGLNQDRFIRGWVNRLIHGTQIATEWLVQSRAGYTFPENIP